MANDLLYGNTGIDTVLDTISRTVAITNTVPVTSINLLNSNQLVDWQFTIRETTGITNIDLTITIYQQNSNYIIKQPLSRGGSWTYQGYGSVTIDAVAINAGTGSLEFSIKPLTSTIPYIMVAGQTTFQTLTGPGTWDPVDSLSNATPSGFSPPFCKFVTILPSFTTSYRFVDQTGVAVWTSAVLLHTDLQWREIRLFPWHSLEVMAAVGVQAITSLWHN